MTDNQATALVTGGTSGIGRAITARLARRGMNVFLCARDEAAVDETVAELTGEGLRGDGIATDVRDPHTLHKLVRATVDRFGPISVLVNNAGRSGGGYTASITDELWDDVMETNLNSVFRLTREALTTGELGNSGDGRIINIASTGGKQGVPLGAPYSASKAGVIGFTKALAKELATSGITVNAVCPGYVETPMAARIREAYANAGKVTEQEILADFQAKIPLGRYSTADEVAGLVEYLTTAEAASITAQALNVCGGLGSY
ncbi:SDR family NAD(P)-dependent oxidoreductase [Sciscionella marina]|uniref:SDR family NAD(P)-dependent oxidoreductase n=1 Tax=Sciscionella marina TaxID=508770 RepID=UPI00036F4B68|nr:SDR family NAD(P)-dependent oxidoreductase [Sciscionella marina]